MTAGQRFAAAAGGAYVIVGIVGFLLAPDIFDIFGVNTPHNVLHLVLGVAWLWVFPDRAASKATNLIAGAALLILAGLGFAGLLDVDGLVNLNVQSGVADANNWLHAVTGAVALGLGVAGWRTSFRGLPPPR